ncbi:hypothetical protein APSETT445_004522 [Aspergillus pseudonomiae]
MPSSKTVALFTLGLASVKGALAALNLNSPNNIAVYWEPMISEDIKECQSLGRTILLSIGGATYNEGGFSSEAAAVAGAKMIWETFGPVSNSSAKRPFGDAVVDGFDFDFEAVVNNMPAFGNQLRSYYASDTSKKYYTTAAPQCPYPDAADGPMLNGAVYFDAIWIQFYNNFCGLQSFVPGSSTQNNFNFDVWDKWARETSLNKNAKVFLGVPGNQGAAGTGYQPISRVSEIIQYVKNFSSFGGAMIWDASQRCSNYDDEPDHDIDNDLTYPDDDHDLIYKYHADHHHEVHHNQSNVGHANRYTHLDGVSGCWADMPD